MHLGIGFVVRSKLVKNEVKNEEFQHNLELAIPRPNSTTTGQNRMKLSTMTEYIHVLKLCTWVLVLSCDQNWGRTTGSKPIPRYLTKMIYSVQAMKRLLNEIVG